MSIVPKTVAILGGTGRVGLGLALCWGRAGYGVIIGSRRLEKAQRTASELNERLGQPLVRGMANPDAAQACDVAVLAVPYAAQALLLESLGDTLRGRLLPAGHPVAHRSALFFTCAHRRHALQLPVVVE
jgi:NADPH-dependent F420 reductase